nr:putative tail tubular protein B [uncultured Mediterranean phage uvMED]
MARVAAQLTNFTAGELSPRLDGRNDLSKYPAGCKTLENIVIYPHGAAARRPGTQFISEVKTSSAKTRLIPFEFSTTQTYILEFGNQYMRVYKDKGQVLSGGSAFEISTPYLTAELFDIKFAQSADVMYLTHPSHETKKLSRTGHTAWTLATVDFTNGPFLDTNTSTTTFQPSGTSGSVNITASASTFVSTDVGRLIRIGDGIAKVTGFTSATVVAVTTSTNFANTNAVTDWSLGAFSETTGFPSCVTFFEQRLVFAATLNNPQTIYFSKSGDYENMDANIGGTVADDDAIVYTIASNQVNAIRFLSPTRTLIIGTAGGEFAVYGGGDNDAITPTNIIIKKQSNFGGANVDAVPVGNATLFLQRAKRKIRELAYNFDVDGYIAPDLTILAEHITKGGITQMAYQEEPLSIVYAVREDGELVALTYQRDQQVVAWHRHIFGGVFGTGNAVCESVAVIPTDLDEYEVYVIIKRTINGATKRYVEVLNTFDFTETDNTSFNYLDSQLNYDGVSSTLNGDISNSATTVVVADGTNFNSSGKIKIGKEIIAYTGKSTNNLTGCTRGQNLTTAAAHTSGDTVDQVVETLSGLTHLEGQTVSILADGATHPTKTVSSGAISLDRASKKVKVGLSYTSLLQTMRIDAGSQNGTSQGKTKRIYEITIRLFETVGVEVGPDLDNMERIPFRSSANPMNEGIAPFTGDKEVEFRGNYDTDGFIVVRQTQPLPLTVLSVYPRLVTNDG